MRKKSEGLQWDSDKMATNMDMPIRNSRKRVSTHPHICDQEPPTSVRRSPRLLRVLWGPKVVVVRRQPDYAATISAISKARTLSELKNVSFHLEAMYDSCMGEITEDAWPEAVSELTEVIIVEDNSTPAIDVCQPVQNEAPVLWVRTLTGKMLSLPYAGFHTIGELKRIIQDKVDKPAELQRLIFVGRQLDDERTLSEYRIAPGSTLHLVERLMGGKPVIYIMSPHVLEDVSVSLSLVPAWSFSALYPTADIDRSDGTETVQWIVDASPDGTLLDKRSHLRVSYLFWEAETHPAVPLTPASSRPSSPECQEHALFDPSRPLISPEDAVLLSIDKVPSYLDEALKVLTLHTEARTSFITYWLPSLLKHEHVALKFLPQTSYEAAAPLNVSPAPDVMTRVFMLFRGIEASDLNAWNVARSRADADVSHWVKTVGIDVEKASDTTLYRVLEWGGMEIR